MKAFPLASVVAGFVTVLVGVTSSIPIVFQAAGATPEQTSSWIGALGMGLTCIALSLRYKAPVVTAWSTPGAALLVTSLVGVPLAEATGAFLFSGALIALCGLTGWFERSIDRMSRPIAAAMLAGILAGFGFDVFTALKTQFGLVLVMFGLYLVGKRLWPRYAVIGALVAGILVAGAQGLLRFESFRLALAMPVFTVPAFSASTLIGVGIPLFVVTMASQNVPGVAVMRATPRRSRL